MDFMPYLSEPDPGVSAESMLDPLGLGSIADTLGRRLAPGVRERQSRPRFLTALAVSLAVCDPAEFEGLESGDGVSEPWQVLEWHLVEGLVRRVSEPDRLRNLPGREKAQSALGNKEHLHRDNYLKTPAVFGFHGVYRVLARELGIEAGGLLGARGEELLGVWTSEQELPGFWPPGATGSGRQVMDSLRAAVKEGMKEARVRREDGWSGFSFFAEHLLHTETPPREREALRRALIQPGSGWRAELMRFIISPKGQAILNDNDAPQAERRIHQALWSAASPELKQMLDAIMAYEAFARLLLDAFLAILTCMEQARGKAHPAEFAALHPVRQAEARIPDLFVELLDRLEPYGETPRFRDQFESLSAAPTVLDWTEALLEHHRRVQRNKPPAGRVPWFDRYDDGGCILRQRYVAFGRPRGDDGYVHGYRTFPLRSFCHDLGLLD